MSGSAPIAVNATPATPAPAGSSSASLSEIYSNFSPTHRAWCHFFSTKEEHDFPDPRIFTNVEDNQKNVQRLRGLTLEIAMRKIQSLFVKRTRFVTSGTAPARKQRLSEFYANAQELIASQDKLRAERSGRRRGKRHIPGDGGFHKRGRMDAALVESTIAALGGSPDERQAKAALIKQEIKLKKALELKAIVDMCIALEVPVDDNFKAKLMHRLQEEASPAHNDDAMP